MQTKQRMLRVAAGQMVAHDLADAAGAFDVMARLADAARRANAALLVLPECTYPAYWLVSPDQYRAAPRLGTPAVLERLSKLAAANRLHLVCGLVEETGDRLYNAAAVFDPAGGLIGMARKTFLWDCDNRWFTPGDCISVFDTSLGRIGVQICADARAPETTATLAAKGAELVAMPTAWVNVGPEPDALFNIQPEFLIESRAREFGVPFVCADKTGREGPMRYVGQSMVVDGEGQVMQRAANEGEALIVQEIHPRRGRVAAMTPPQQTALLAAPNVKREIEQRARNRAALDRTRTHRRVVLRAGRDGFETGSARAGVVRGNEVLSFVTARCLALDGLQAIGVPDAPDDLATLRTRAAENRVFVLGVCERWAAIIAPDGDVRATDDPAAGVSASVDISEADIKQFTPETGLWAQRRTGCYAFDSTP